MGLGYSAEVNSDSLEAFVEFSKVLNFTRAAESLSISQPALHVKIKKLSQELGVPLYSKKGRTLSLTPYGVELARFGRESRAQTEVFLQTLVQGHHSQTVVLAAGSGAYLYLLGGALSRFRECEAGDLRLLTANATRTVDLVRTGEAHMGVTVLESVPPDLQAVLIHRAPGTLVVPKSHPLARRKSLSVTHLEGLGLIVPPLGMPFRGVVGRTLESRQVNWRVAVEASGWELMIHFAELGLGVAIVNGCCRLPSGLRAIPIREFPVAKYYLLNKRTLAFSEAQQHLYEEISSL